MAVNKFQSGGVDNNWGTTGNWSLGAVPTATDLNVATFDATSPACTVNTSARVCNNIDFTGYTHTITMSQNISVSGNITLGFGAGGAASGAGILIAHTAGNLTSSGSTWAGTLRGDAAVILTLLDNWTVTTLQPGSANINPTTWNGFKINITTNLDLSIITTGMAAGTTEFVMAGTGSILSPSSTGVLRNPLTINTAGTITFPTGAFRYGTGTLTYTAGTIANINNTDLICTISATFAFNVGSANAFNSLTLTGVTQTYTFNADLYTMSFLPQSTTTTIMTLNGASADLYVAGNITITNTTSGGYSGTLRTIFVSTIATLSWASNTTGAFIIPLHVNAPGLTVTVTSPFPLNIGKFSLTAGTMTTDSTWPSASGGGLLLNPGLSGGLR